MNPFDLPGPQFLVFYAVAGIALLAWLVGQQWRSETAPAPALRLSDPYLIAYLHGGSSAARQVAVVSLIDRGLLKLSGADLETSVPTAPDLVKVPLERALLKKFAAPQPPVSIFDDPTLQQTDVEFERPLLQFGLLPNAVIKSARLNRYLLALGLLWGVAGMKIMIALSRGRSNVFFLIVLGLAFAVAALFMVNRTRTRRGDVALADLKTLFAGMKSRAASFRPGASPDEVALLAAVFGVGALPSEYFPHIKALYPKAASSTDSSWSSGSSCGSSCGGGCGGGCGGCGG